MNRYELLKKNETIIYQLVKNGIMSFQIIRDMEIYEKYNQLDEINNTIKYILLTDEFELGVKRIEQIIYSMSGKVQ